MQNDGGTSRILVLVKFCAPNDMAKIRISLRHRQCLSVSHRNSSQWTPWIGCIAEHRGSFAFWYASFYYLCALMGERTQGTLPEDLGNLGSKLILEEIK